MVSVQAAKWKGSRFEYSCWDSLKPIMPDILITKQLGMQTGYDLISKNHQSVFECKFHKSLTWNELVKYFKKLQHNAPPDYSCYVLYKTNFQPVLVMFESLADYGKITVQHFVDFFNTPEVVHVGSKK